jgi:hypothetical protein
MVKSRRYRAEVISAVKTFRPVLMALNIRELQHRPVFLAEFDHLHLLDLDSCSIEVLIADLGECIGMFASAYTDTGLLRCYIILNRSLFEDKTTKVQQQLKITGIHEFCHFVAIIYAATTVSIKLLKENILSRLNAKIDKLPHENLIQIYNMLANDTDTTDSYPDELTDRHFRLDIEGETPDYNVLFYHFMFSKDLFETDFDETKQIEFKRLMHCKSGESQKKAVEILLASLKKITNEKHVPYKMALRQLMQWVHSYIE